MPERHYGRKQRIIAILGLEGPPESHLNTLLFKPIPYLFLNILRNGDFTNSVGNPVMCLYLTNVLHF